MKGLVISIYALAMATVSSGQEIKRVKIMDLEKIIAESRTPLIVNFWATWCIPCIEELPYFHSEVKRYNDSAGAKDSLQLLLVSLDDKDNYPTGIQSVAAKRKFTAPILWLNETNADYFCPKIDSKWSGAIPSTLFINNRTGYRKFMEQQIPVNQFKKEIIAIVGKLN